MKPRCHRIHDDRHRLSRTRGGRRRGIALIAVLVAVVIVGILIAGAFFGSTQELRIGRASVEQERALAAAEYGLHSMLTDLLAWLRSDDLTPPVGMHEPVEHEGLTSTGSITRLGELHFWIVSRAVARTADAGDATRRVGAFAVIDVPDLMPAAAIAFSGRGPTTEVLDGSALRIDGGDAPAAGSGACHDSAGPVAGLALSEGASFGASPECPIGSCITGSPAILVTSELNDAAALAGVGEAPWNELTSRATITLTAGSVIGGGDSPLRPHVVDGRCDRTVHHNWGDIDRTTLCAGYFPIVHAVGDLRLMGGAGQGILVVEGDLHLSGGVRFAGAVLVRGSLRTSDGGGHVTGAVWVAGQGATSSSLGGGGAFEYSRCDLLAALSRHGTPAFLPRSWTEIY